MPWLLRARPCNWNLTWRFPAGLDTRSSDKAHARNQVRMDFKIFVRTRMQLIPTRFEGGVVKNVMSVYSWQYWVLQNGQNLRTKMPKVLRQDNTQVEIRFNTSKLYCAKCIAPLQEEPVLISLKTKHGCSLVGTFCCRSRIAGFVSACGPLARKLLKLLKAPSGFPWSLSVGFDISVQPKSSKGTVEATVTHRIKSLMIFHDVSLWICSSPLHLYKAGHEWLWITGLGYGG